MIYLASPYSHPVAAVREARFKAACRAAARLMQDGEVVFSPIAHSHPIAAFGLPVDWLFWERFDGGQLVHADEIAVLMLDGWRESRGVQAEIRLATDLGKPVRYLAPHRPPTLARVAKE